MGCPVSALCFAPSHPTAAGDEEEALNQELAKGKKTDTGDVGSVTSHITCQKPQAQSRAAWV